MCLRNAFGGSGHGIRDIFESILNTGQRFWIFPSNISCNTSLKFRLIQRYLCVRYWLSCGGIPPSIMIWPIKKVPLDEFFLGIKFMKIYVKPLEENKKSACCQFCLGLKIPQPD